MKIAWKRYQGWKTIPSTWLSQALCITKDYIGEIGRHYIGSKISEKYVSMAYEKIRIEQSQLKLF